MNNRVVQGSPDWKSGAILAAILAGAMLAIAGVPANAQDKALSERAKGLDANNNGVVDRAEARGPMAENFDKIDKNKSGSLDGAEIRVFFSGGGGGGPAARVDLDTVVEEEARQTAPVIGRIVARQSGPVAARIGGPIDDMLVDVGDRVKTGDILAIVDRDKLRAERERYAALVAQRKADLDTATAEVEKKELELKRFEGIRNSAAFNQSRYDDVRKDIVVLTARLANSRAQLRAAGAQLRIAAFELRDAEIRAPFDGIVSIKHTEVGAYVSASSPVVTLINDRAVDIEAPVPATRLAGLKPGHRVIARLDDGTEITAVVRATIPDENPLTRTRPVRFTPDVVDAAGRFAANQTVTVEVPYGEIRKVVTVSKDAITQRNGTDTVFVVVDGVAQPRRVELGDPVGSRFAVVEGLKPGDVTVVRGNENLRPGSRVRTGKGAPAHGKTGGG